MKRGIILGALVIVGAFSAAFGVARQGTRRKVGGSRRPRRR
jgi:hypothetical protein